MDTAKEQRTLVLSIAVTLTMALVGIVFGLSIGSQSIIFDGVFSAIDVVVTSAALMVSRLVVREGSRRFQYGYWHLEPMVTALNGCIMLLVCLYAFVNGLDGLLAGGRTVNFEQASLFATVAAVIGFGMYAFVAKVAKALDSEFLRIDAGSWFMDSALSLALLVSFLVALLVGGSRFAWLTAYADPMVLILLAVLLVPTPIGILRRSLREIFLVAPTELDAKVRAVLDEIKQRHAFRDVRAHLAKTGRAHFVEITILTPPDFAKERGVEALDRIRDEIAQAIGDLGPQPWLTISFTTEEKWL